MKNARESFLLGYWFGKSTNHTELSAREVQNRFPTVDVPSFVEGMLDGLANDAFRLTLLDQRKKAWPIVR